MGDLLVGKEAPIYDLTYAPKLNYHHPIPVSMSNKKLFLEK